MQEKEYPLYGTRNHKFNWAIALAVFLSVPLMEITLSLIQHRSPNIAASFVGSACFVYVVFYIWFLSRYSTLAISDAGLEHRCFSPRMKLSWEEIESVRIVNTRRSFSRKTETRVAILSAQWRQRRIVAVPDPGDLQEIAAILEQRIPEKIQRDQ